ncbi:MAG: hypothetical protein WD400_01775, partial [Pontimonas sp.]
MAKAKSNGWAAGKPGDSSGEVKKQDVPEDASEATAASAVAQAELAEHDGVLDASQIDPSAIVSDQLDSQSVVLDSSGVSYTLPEAA